MEAHFQFRPGKRAPLLAVAVHRTPFGFTDEIEPRALSNRGILARGDTPVNQEGQVRGLGVTNAAPPAASGHIRLTRYSQRARNSTISARIACVSKWPMSQRSSFQASGAPASA